MSLFLLAGMQSESQVCHKLSGSFFVNDGCLKQVECGVGSTSIWHPNPDLYIPRLYLQLRETPLLISILYNC